MAKSKKKNQEGLLFLFMGIIIISLVIVGFFLFKQQFSEMLESTSKTASTVAEEAAKHKSQVVEEEYIPQEEVQNLIVYYGIKGKDKLEAETKRVRKSKMLISQARQVVNSLLEAPANERLSKLLPDGLTLRGLFYESGVFTIDFSREFNEVFYYGPKEQILAVYSIVNSICELDPNARVKFMINGSEIDGEDGHVEMLMPLTKLASIIEE